MNTLADTKKYGLIKEALFRFYSGAASSMVKAFEGTRGVSRNTYYDYKRRFPREMEALEEELQQEATHTALEQEIAFQRDQQQFSQEMQRRAREAVLGNLKELTRIAGGETVVVEHEGKTRVIIPYPRDQIGASSLLLDIARGGVRPENVREVTIALPSPQEQDSGVMPMLGPGGFSKVTAQRPDGTIVEASVKPGDVIDAE